MKIDNFINTKYKKIDIALSNDVFYKNGWFYKKYSHNDFKTTFLNQDLEALKLISKTKLKLKYKIYDDGVATKKLSGYFLDYQKIDQNHLEKIISQAIYLKHIPLELTKNIKPPGFFKAIELFDKLNYVNEIFEDEKIIIEQVLQNSKNQVAFCHNDLIPDNIIFNNLSSKAKFIDYEYSGMINFHFDIASIFNSWVLNDDLYLFGFNKFSKFLEVDSIALKQTRLFLLIFWSKLCDYKYNETKRIFYLELKKNIISLRPIIELQATLN